MVVIDITAVTGLGVLLLCELVIELAFPCEVVHLVGPTMTMIFTWAAHDFFIVRAGRLGFPSHFCFLEPISLPSSAATMSLES